MKAVVGTLQYKGKKVYKILNATSFMVYCIFEENLIAWIEDDDNSLVNAKYDPDKNEIVGKQGSLDRFKNSGTLVILKELIVNSGETVGYIVGNAKGEVIKADVRSIIRLAALDGIQNGAIVERNGKKFIRAISGRYSVESVEEALIKPKCRRCVVGNDGILAVKEVKNKLFQRMLDGNLLIVTIK